MILAQNEKGEEVKLQLLGNSEEARWLSRIFQHEYDHLQVGLILLKLSGAWCNYPHSFIMSRPRAFSSMTE
jgi:hypothetical protein